jgi:rubrerythrin
MANEQNKTIEGLRTAIQMEIDGKKFYLESARTAVNPLGARLFETLAGEEDNHRRKFEEIFQAIQNKKAWPSTGFIPDGGKKLRTIFAQATEKKGSNTGTSTELDAIQMAMGMENKTYDFYTYRAGKADFAAEKEFYLTVAGEEREHHLVLLDYFEYLKNPAGWFVQKEHHSLDGG